MYNILTFKTEKVRKTCSEFEKTAVLFPTNAITRLNSVLDPTLLCHISKFSKQSFETLLFYIYKPLSLYKTFYTWRLWKNSFISTRLLVFITLTIFVYFQDLDHSYKKNLLFTSSQINSIHNPLSTNPTKWSNKLPTNCLSVFDHFMGWCLKGYNVHILSVMD